MRTNCNLLVFIRKKRSFYISSGFCYKQKLMKIKQIFSKRNILLGFLILAAFIELGCISFLRKEFGVYGTPLVQLGSGLFIGIAFLHLFYKRTLNFSEKGNLKPSHLIDLICLLIGSYFCFEQIYQFTLAHPIDDFYTATSSDVVPAIGIMVDRFWNGVFPYTFIEIEEWGFTYRLLPGYLPLTWMPFLGAKMLNVDYRLYAFGILHLSLIALYWRFIFKEPSNFIRFFAIILPFSFLYLFSFFNFELKFVVEPMIVGFYLLLILSFFSKRNWSIILTLVICLLSRYSVVLFVPLIFFVLALEKGWLTSFRISLGVGLGILLIYVIPFLSKDFSVLENGFNTYTKTTLEAWELSNKQPLESNYSIFNSGVGMSIFAYRHLDKPIEEKLDIFKKTHLLLSILVVIILAVFYWKMQSYYDYRIFLLGGLKVYMVIFYDFIQYPFVYLFLVPTFISLPMIYISLRKTNWYHLAQGLGQAKAEVEES